MLRFYCFLTGDNYLMIAKDTPKSQQKVKILGNALLVPVIIWTVSSFLLARQVLATSISAAIITSICCTILISLIERIILMSKNNSKTALLSFFLGGCIALMGSLVIEQIVFAEDIDYMLQKNREKYAKQVAAERGQIFDSVQQMQLKLEYLLAMKAAVKEAEQLAINEMDDKGSGIKGTGGVTGGKTAIARSRTSILMKDKSTYDSLMQQKALLMQTAKDRALIEFKDGLIVRVNVFFKIVLSDWIMAAVLIIFSLLMFSLNFLVIIVQKLVPESNYEKRVRIIDEIGDRRMNVVYSLISNRGMKDFVYRTWSGQKNQ
ncbi:DUF4407 domain-containing protein [Danxiaibacter flavus]|uniref:DUF4407 domain-containing protein n=1 Tax=Danxiaibacter flavus TaxID=3049108 RepID=A0ABV3ZIR0_9BACT|nr:DUF4407 domain-containing protein [Chitinophagaceae bacterium DXS]